MKLIRIILFLSAFNLSIRANDLLDIDTVFNTKVGVEFALKQCYMGFSAIYGYSFQELNYRLVDNVKHVYKTGIDKFSPNDPVLKNIYLLLYSQINNTYVFDKHVKLAPITDNLKTIYLAESAFLRALANFHLLMMFRNPTFLSSFVIEDIHPYLFNEFYIFTELNYSDRSALFEHIKEDIQNSIDGLPWQHDYEIQNVFRANRGSAYALLGKLYLYFNQWQNAINTFSNLSDSTDYDLIRPQLQDSLNYFSAYASNFNSPALTQNDSIYPTVGNVESVFEIEYSNNEHFNYLPGWGLYGSLYKVNYSQFNSALIAPEERFLKQFEKVSDPINGLVFDPRRSASVLIPGDTIRLITDTLVYHYIFNPDIHVSSLLEADFGNRKYIHPTDDKVISYSNWRMIRYSDILLMTAEAELHLNGSSVKVDSLINVVRSRAGLSKKTNADFRDIIHEREVEFGFECLRLWDLFRWSRLDVPWVNGDTIFFPGFNAEFDSYLPIPNYDPYKISISDSIFNELPDDDILIGILSTEDANDIGNFRYFLVSDQSLNSDNHLFRIELNRLYATRSVKSEIKNKYNLKIEVLDVYGSRYAQNFSIYYQGQTSLKHLSDGNIRVYPTHVTEKLYIENNGNVESIELYSLEGDLVKRINKIRSEHLAIDFEQFDNGVYIVHVLSVDDQSFTVKVVKAK